MMEPTRLLWGAPGGVLAGHSVDDVARRILADRAAQTPRHAIRTIAMLSDLLREVTDSLAEVERMRAEMGEKRMAHDEKRQTLRRANASAGLLLQQELAHLTTLFAPGDPEAEHFAPAAALSAGTSSTQRRITRLDKLRHAYLALPHLPDASDRAERLGAASVRLFRAVAEATGVDPEPVPLGEARQRFDRGYVMLRDTVRALQALQPEALLECFPDLSPVWRRTDLARP